VTTQFAALPTPGLLDRPRSVVPDNPVRAGLIMDVPYVNYRIGQSLLVWDRKGNRQPVTQNLIPGGPTLENDGILVGEYWANDPDVQAPPGPFVVTAACVNRGVAIHPMIDATDFAAGNRTYSFYANSQKLTIITSHNGTLFNLTSTAANVMEVGKFVAVSAFVDIANGVVRLYSDGTLRKTASVPSGSFISPTGQWAGWGSVSASRKWDGWVMYQCLHHRELTAGEIRELHAFLHQFALPEGYA
jgi:hypothetical protein